MIHRSLSTCAMRLPTCPSPPLTGNTFLVTSPDRLRTYPSNTGYWQRRLVLDSLSDLSQHILSSVHSIVDILQTLFFVFFFLVSLPCGYFLSNQSFIFSQHFCKWVTDLLTFLCPQMNGVPLYRWKTGGFLRQPGTTSPVNGRALSTSRHSPSVISKCPVCFRF